MKSLFSRSLILPFFLCALTSCALMGEGDQQNYVLRAPVVEVSALNPLPLHLKIMPVEVAPGLDSTRISLIEHDVQLNYLADARWVEGLPQMLQFLWGEAFKQSHIVTSVSSDNAGAKADRLINITANAFNAVRGADQEIHIHIAYEAKIIAPLSHVVLAVESVSIEEKAASPALEDVMQTFNKTNAAAMQQLLAKVAADLRK